MKSRSVFRSFALPILLVLAAIGIDSLGVRVFQGNFLAQVSGGVTPQNFIPLAFQNLANVNRQNIVVSGGIPLPQSVNITNTANLRVLRNIAGTYSEVPAQFRVLSRWFGLKTNTAKPIRWVLVTFPASAGSNQMVTDYSLDYGTAVQSATPAQPVNVTNSATSVTVDTGAAIYTISKTSFNIFNSVQLRDNGTLVDVITPATAATNEIFLRDQTGTIHTSRHPVTVTVRESGPVRAVLEIKGGLRPAESNTNYLTQTIEMIFDAGRTDVAIRHVLENNGPYWGGPVSNPIGAKYFNELTFKLQTDIT